MMEPKHLKYNLSIDMREWVDTLFNNAVVVCDIDKEEKRFGVFGSFSLYLYLTQAMPHVLTKKIIVKNFD